MSETTENLFQQALSAHQQGDLDRAKILYEEVLTQQPQHAHTMHLLGMLAAQADQLEVAIAWIEKAIALLANEPVFYNNLGNAYKGQQQLEKASQCYQKAIALKPDYAEAYSNLGSLLYQQNQLKAALQAYWQALQLKPDFVSAHYNVGLLFIKQKKLSEAIKQFNNVIELHPQAITAYIQLANLYMLEEQFDQAEHHYQVALQLDPENADTLNNLGVLCLKQEAAQQAVEYFTKALAIDDKHLDARSNLAATFLQHDRYQNAISHYEEFLKQQPQDIEVNYNIAVALMALGELKKAINHYEKVLAMNPEHVDALVNLGTVFMRLNKKSKTIALFNQALTLQPDNTAVQYMLHAILGDEQPATAPVAYIKNLFDNYAIQYDQHLLKSLKYQGPQLLYDLLQKTIGKKQAQWQVLDLGCGTGLSGEAFQLLAKKLVGVDLSPKMVALAEKKSLYNELHVADINMSLQTLQNQYDLIIAVDVFNYLGDLTTTFKYCQQALTANGLLAFTVEKTTGDTFTLQSNARYAHGKAYIEKLAQEVSLTLLACEENTVRRQDNKAVIAYFFVFRNDGGV